MSLLCSFSLLFLLLCSTSLVKVTGSYTEDKPIFCFIVLETLVRNCFTSLFKPFRFSNLSFYIVFMGPFTFLVTKLHFCSTTTLNLVPRVLWLFGQRVGARRESLLTPTNLVPRREKSTRALGCPHDTGHRDVTSCEAREFVHFPKWHWRRSCIKGLFFRQTLNVFVSLLNGLLIFFSRYR